MPGHQVRPEQFAMVAEVLGKPMEKQEHFKHLIINIHVSTMCRHALELALNLCAYVNVPRKGNTDICDRFQTYTYVPLF